jgi:hypothetical protein
MTEANTKRDIGHKWLRLLDVARSTSSRVSHVPQPNVADELDHVLKLEDIAHQPIVLVQVQAAALVGGDDACAR